MKPGTRNPVQKCTRNAVSCLYLNALLYQRLEHRYKLFVLVDVYDLWEGHEAVEGALASPYATSVPDGVSLYAALVLLRDKKYDCMICQYRKARVGRV